MATLASHRPLWDTAGTTGSVVASLAKNIALGAILLGIAVRVDPSAGG